MDAVRSPEERLADVGAKLHHPNAEAHGPRAGAGRRQDGGAEAKPGSRPNKLRLLRVADAMAEVLRVYLLHGLLGAGEFSLWWGAPKSGKSFLLLRIAYALALGLDMWGLKAAPCAVIYIAAEGGGGFGGRVRALAEKMGEAHRFRYIARGVDFLNDATHRDEVVALGGALLDECERLDGVRPHLLLVVDTYHRSAPGADENSARDAGRFVASVDAIREQTGAHVAVVHHGGVSGERPRGSTALEAAADLVVKVAKRDGGNSATVDAAKDDANGTVYGFTLEPAPLPAVDGMERWTRIAEPTGAPAAARAEDGARIAGQAELALRDFHDAAARPGTERRPVPADANASVPPGTMAIRQAAWRKVFNDRFVDDGDDDAKRAAERRKKAFGRAVSTLRSAGRIGVHEGWVWDAKPRPSGHRT